MMCRLSPEVKAINRSVIRDHQVWREAPLGRTRFQPARRHKRSTLGSRPAIYRLSLYPLRIAQGLGPHRMPTTPLIAYAHVGKTFDDGRVVAVDDVSLDVAEGEF